MSDAAETQDMGQCPACGRVNPADARFCAGCGFRLAREADEGAAGGAEVGAVVADPLIGRTIADRYKIIGLIGRGGMGVVYKVEHIHIGKLMAMKLLHGELARDKETVKRFRREALSASRLSHPNTVQIFDFGQSKGLTYLVMEYLEGRDFGAVIQQDGPLSFARVARICAQVCASVGEAHDHGIVHRDLKPENVMITQTRSHKDFVKVLDFGLAKLRAHGDMGHVTVTRAGSIIGTPYYMSPEQIRGDEVDARGDVYSIGAMMYKACTGVPPFWAATPVGVLTKHLTDPVVPMIERSSRRDLPAEADRIVLKAMEKDPRDRFQRAEELRQALLEYLAAIGEDLSDASIAIGGVPASITSASGRRKVEVATRGDVDKYERRLRRRGFVGYTFAVLVLACALAGGTFVWKRAHTQPLPTSESEPNDKITEADTAPRGIALRGQIGRRIDDRHSDADVYVIRNPGGGRRVIRFEVTAMPNMDLVVDVVRQGIEAPVLRADSGGVGAPERVPNFPLRGSTYYLRVRENWESGEPPTESISDHYTLTWDFVEPGPDDESEVNDSLELAQDVPIGAVRRGYIGWGGDIDTYCLAEDGAGVSAELSGIVDLDLVLRVVDRMTATSTKIDANGVGGAESSPAIPIARASQTCFEVSADDTEEGAKRSNPDVRYELRILRAEAR